MTESTTAKDSKEITVVVMGLGYVGLPLALLCAEKGYRTYGFDLDQQKVAMINAGKSPIKDEQVQSELEKSLLEATTDEKVIRLADIVIMCVPTPVADRKPNLKPLIGATQMVGQYAKSNALVIVESTVNPGVCDEVVIPELKKLTGRSAEQLFVAHCPERINPGDQVWSVKNIPRVLGANNDTALDAADVFYSYILEGDVKRMGNLKEAEAVKVVENSFRNVNIAFVNELAMSFNKLGINVVNVIDGAATKPFAFMAHYPGMGVGGHCIPVDPHYLIDYAETHGFDHRFLQLATEVNDEMPDYTVDLIEQTAHRAGLEAGYRVGILGLSYKANVDDDRESPVYEVIGALNERDIEYDVFDPILKARSTVETLEQLLERTDLVLVATAHDEFAEIEVDTLKELGIAAVVDGRNAVSDEVVIEITAKGIEYAGIGVQANASSVLEPVTVLVPSVAETPQQAIDKVEYVAEEDVQGVEEQFMADSRGVSAFALHNSN